MQVGMREGCDLPAVGTDAARIAVGAVPAIEVLGVSCLLYTSDAADEL